MLRELALAVLGVLLWPFYAALYAAIRYKDGHWTVRGRIALVVHRRTREAAGRELHRERHGK